MLSCAVVRGSGRYTLRMVRVPEAVDEHRAELVTLVGPRRASKRWLLLVAVGALFAAQLWRTGPAGILIFVFWLPMSSRRRVTLARGALRVRQRRVAIEGDLLEGDLGAGELQLPRTPEGWTRSSDAGYEAVVRLADERLLAASFTESDAARAFLAATGVGDGLRRFRLTSHAFGPARGLGRWARGAVSTLLRLGSALVMPTFVVLASGAIFPHVRGLIGALGRVTHFGFGLAFIVAIVVLALLDALVVRPSVELGLDGLFVRSLGVRRFVPYRDVRALHVHSRGVALELVDGRTMLLPLGPEPRIPLGSIGIVARDTSDIAALREALRESIAERRERARVPVDRQVARSVADEHAPDAIASAGRYRAPSIGTQAVIELLESPGATPEERLDAARALCATGDGGLRRRVRVAAEQCVDPALVPELARLAGADAEGVVADASDRCADEAEGARARV